MESPDNMAVSKERPNITTLITEYLEIVEGYFSTDDCCRALNLTSAKERNAVRVALHRFVKCNTLERYGKKEGVFRRPQRKLERIDFINVNRNFINLQILPELKDPKAIHLYGYCI
jgi:hypothetical protein